MKPPRRIKSGSKKPGGKIQPDLVEKSNQPFSRSDFERLWARVPLTVLCDERLTHSDVSVFAAVAYFVWQGTICRESVVDIAKIARRDRAGTIASLKRLCETGHLQRAPGARERQVQTYMATSPLFGQKQGKKTEIIRGASGTPRFASVAIEDVA